MTCGIDGDDDDFTPFNLPPISLVDPKEIWNENQKAIWNGREVRVLNPKDHAIPKALDILSQLSLEKSDAHFFERLVEVLTFAGMFAEEEESLWDFAPVQELLSTQITEDMTLEQYLEKTGMMFDRELGQYIECRNWFMKQLHEGEKWLRKSGKKIDKKRREFFHTVEKGAREGIHVVEKGVREGIHVVEKGVREGIHVVEKGVREGIHVVEKGVREGVHCTEKAVRHTYKDIEEFVKENKTEVIIAAAAVAVVAAYFIPAVSKAAAVVIALLLGDDSKSKNEERLASSSPEGNASPRFPDSSRCDYKPLIQADQFMEKMFGNLLSKQATSSSSGIYPLDAEQQHSREFRPPPSVKAPEASSSNNNFVQQFYDNLFQGNPNLNPNRHIGKIQPAQKTENLVPSAPSEENPVCVPDPEPSPSASSPLKSYFGTYLENLHHGHIVSIGPVSSGGGEQIIQQDNPNASVDTAAPVNGFTRFLEIVRQGLETIGRMSGPEVDSLDVLDGQQSMQQNNDSASGTQSSENSIPQSQAFYSKDFFDLIVGNLEKQGHEEFSVKSELTKFLETITTHILQNSAPIVPLIMGPPEPGLSRPYKIEGIEKEGMHYTNENGINNTFDLALENAKYLQSLSPSKPSIQGIYNHTNYPHIDILEIFLLNYAGCSPHTADFYVKDWTEFHNKYAHIPDAKIFHSCHSQGAIHTKNALLRLPPEIRNRIIVVAIAPAVVVPRQLCYASFNYASKNDLVPFGELIYNATIVGSDVNPMALLKEIAENQKEITWLDPDGAKGLNHSFQSPIFMPILKKHLEDYEKHGGIYP